MGPEADDGANIALCASCDRCRARKTRCDGNRPCGNCASKYLKKNKLSSTDGIPLECFECIYSPAKRRGPVPGRVGRGGSATATNGSGNTDRKIENVGSSGASLNTGLGGSGGSDIFAQQQQNEIAMLQQRQLLLAQAQQQQQMQALGMAQQLQDQSGLGDIMNVLAGNSAGVNTQQQASAIQQQLNLLQQLQAQQQQQQIPSSSQPLGGQDTNPIVNQVTSSGISATAGKREMEGDEPSAQRHRSVVKEDDDAVPRCISANLYLLERTSKDGNRLRSYYTLGIDDLFGMPPIPTVDEYCKSLNIPGMVPDVLPESHKSALQAAQFSELSLGALVHNEVPLAMDLSNATVSCLKVCVKEPLHPSYVFEVARAYFLLGCFRAFRGDLKRYFKYRRVCMQHLSRLNANQTGAQIILAAMSYLDAWAYMMHNASEENLPSIDDQIPQVKASVDLPVPATETEKQFGVSTSTKSIVSDPKNQMWIQGAPPVFLNNEAPLPARSLDALSCAVRSCCDQANGRFAQMAQAAAAETGNSAGTEGMPSPDSLLTPTTSAVMAHEDELCSRNMVLSAFTLIQQHEASSNKKGPKTNEGHHLIVSAMDAFLENGDGDSSGFTDSQIQSLLSVCTSAVENPFLLHHGGPTYHMVSNAAILLCHFLNGMHAMHAANGNIGAESSEKAMEMAFFEEVLDTFISVRKILTIHRRKLPVKLRCHGIPRPSTNPDDGRPLIDLGETLMCGCRGCQGFVLMACSPCVAAERAREATLKKEIETAQEAASAGGAEDFELDADLWESSGLDQDDDTLLDMLSSIIKS